MTTTTRGVSGVLVALALSAGLLQGNASAAVAAPQAGQAASQPADDGAAIVGETWVNASTVDLDVKSPALGETLKVRVLVPNGWERDGTKTWPVVFAFGGGGDDPHDAWVKQTDIENVAASWGTLVVMPKPGMYGGHADWWNYGKRGNPRWETFHTLELRQLVERNLRASTKRAVIGVSSGAQGAMTYAGRHPGMFKFAAAYSGILHMTAPGIPAILMILNSSKGKGVDPFRIYGIPGIDVQNWKANDPYELAPKLRGTGLYISAGTTGNHGPLDPTGMTWQEALAARLVGGISESITGATSGDLVRRLKQLKIPATVNLYGPGWHQWRYWDREMKRSWPLVMKAIGAQQTQ